MRQVEQQVPVIRSQSTEELLMLDDKISEFFSAYDGLVFARAQTKGDTELFMLITELKESKESDPCFLRNAIPLRNLLQKLNKFLNPDTKDSKSSQESDVSSVLVFNENLLLLAIKIKVRLEYFAPPNLKLDEYRNLEVPQPRDKTPALILHAKNQLDRARQHAGTPVQDESWIQSALRDCFPGF